MSDTVLGWLFDGWSFGGPGRRTPEQRQRSPNNEGEGSLEGYLGRAAAESGERVVADIDGIPTSELILRLRSDDRAAFTVVCGALRRPLWRLATILTDDPDLADDFVQQAFVALWIGRAHLSPGEDLRAYLRVVIRRAAWRTHRHTRVVERTSGDVALGLRPAPALGQHEPSPDELLHGQEFVQAYTRALTSLTERQRTALQLRLEQDMTFEDIGHMMDISKVAARKLVLTAETRIQALLEEYRP